MQSTLLDFWTCTEDERRQYAGASCPDSFGYAVYAAHVNNSLSLRSLDRAIDNLLI